MFKTEEVMQQPQPAAVPGCAQEAQTTPQQQRQMLFMLLRPLYCLKSSRRRANLRALSSRYVCNPSSYSGLLSYPPIPLTTTHTGLPLRLGNGCSAVALCNFCAMPSLFSGLSLYQGLGSRKCGFCEIAGTVPSSPVQMGGSEHE